MSSHLTASAERTELIMIRALGRKIALEEDMPDPSTPISGAEVRRLNKMGRM